MTISKIIMQECSSFCTPFTNDIVGLQETLIHNDPVPFFQESRHRQNIGMGVGVETGTVQAASLESMPQTSQVMPPETGLMVLESPVHREVSDVQKYISLITTSFLKFQEKRDITMLPSCINALRAFENHYASLYAQDPTQAALIKKDLEEMRQYVQTMNMASPVVTRQDLAMISKFFTKPIEKVFIDGITNKRYIQPDHSRLLQSATPFFKEGNYVGVGLKREKRLTDGRVCDVLYLIKGNDQIDYEKSIKPDVKKAWYAPITAYLPQSQFKKQELQQRIQCQERLFSEVQRGIEGFKIFGYSEFIAVRDDQARSLSLGMTEKAALENHMVFFIYQEIEN